jgi:hypothetical protein
MLPLGLLRGAQAHPVVSSCSPARACLPGCVRCHCLHCCSSQPVGHHVCSRHCTHDTRALSTRAQHTHTTCAAGGAQVGGDLQRPPGERGLVDEHPPARGHLHIQGARLVGCAPACVRVCHRPCHHSTRQCLCASRSLQAVSSGDGVRGPRSVTHAHAHSTHLLLARVAPLHRRALHNRRTATASGACLRSSSEATHSSTSASQRRRVGGGGWGVVARLKLTTAV